MKKGYYIHDIIDVVLVHWGNAAYPGTFLNGPVHQRTVYYTGRTTNIHGFGIGKPVGEYLRDATKILQSFK